MPKLAATLGRFSGPLMPPTTFSSGDVITTNLLDDKCGILVVGIIPDQISAVYRLVGGTIVAISADTEFTGNKDTPNHYNCYFESGAFKIQNLVGANKEARASIYGL